MDISTSLVVSVTPPPFQVGTEEAKRDARLREQIPSPKESHSSEKNQEAVDRRGNTEGTNSNLSALQNAKINGTKQDGGGQGQNQNPDGKNSSVTTSSDANSTTSSHRYSIRHQANPEFSKAYNEAKQLQQNNQTALAKYASIRNISSPAANVIAANQGSLFIASSNTSATSETKSKQNESTNKAEGKDSKDKKSAKSTSDRDNTSHVIAMRYAAVIPHAMRGSFIDIAA